MAFDIGRFQKKYKEVVAENAEMRERIAGWNAGKAAEIEAAVLAAVTPLRNTIQDLRIQIMDRDRQLKTADAAHQRLVARLAEAEEGIAKQNDFIRTLEQRNIELVRQLAETQPQIDLAEGKVRDLLDALKKHEDRMAEKHRQEIAAIENRKVLAGVVPERNRR